MTVSVTSGSALAQLTVAKSLLEEDLLLNWIVNLAPALQLSVKVEKASKKHAHGIELSLREGSLVLNERNAILRALCGMALHHQLDASPYWLLGGHSPQVNASPVAALALAGFASWQSVAASYKTDPSSLDLAQLDAYLQTRAFLIPSHAATLADLDLCLALEQHTDAEVLFAHKNVHRWWCTCRARLAQDNVGDLVLPGPDASPAPPPIFFDGSDAFVPVAASETKAAAAPAKNKAPGQAAPGGGVLTDEQKKAAADKRAQKAAEKAEKKKQKKPQPPPPAAVPLDIGALDIRVGVITKAWHHETADKLFCEEIDVGEDSPRQIASGLRPFYTTEDLQNRKVLVLCNLKARNLVGFKSHGMVLCASNDDHTKVEFVVPPADCPVGERVMFEGIEVRPPEPENKVAKKKIFEALAPELHTNDEGAVVWKDHRAVTTVGPVVAVNGMKQAHVS